MKTGKTKEQTISEDAKMGRKETKEEKAVLLSAPRASCPQAWILPEQCSAGFVRASTTDTTCPVSGCTNCNSTTSRKGGSCTRRALWICTEVAPQDKNSLHLLGKEEGEWREKFWFDLKSKTVPCAGDPVSAGAASLWMGVNARSLGCVARQECQLKPSSCSILHVGFWDHTCVDFTHFLP